MNKEIKDLLEEIQDWMIENDYECGEQGGDIYMRISKIIGKYYDENSTE